MNLKLKQLGGLFKIVKFKPDSVVDYQRYPKPLFVTHSNDELSIIVDQSFEFQSQTDLQVEPDWVGFVVDQPLQFDMIGIIAGISKIMAESQISIMAISSYDTDYFFVKKSNLQRAIDSLRLAGFNI